MKKVKKTIWKRLKTAFVGLFLAIFGVFALPITIPAYAVPDENTPETETVDTVGPEENNENDDEQSAEEDTSLQEENDENDEEEDKELKSACYEETGAIGWRVCPSTGTIAKAIDGIYAVIEGILIVKPLTTDPSSPIHLVWEYAKNITNIIFIIFALVVIYSQITGLGISNYGIKKTLPKIIIAALLVNLSYLICTLAVDLSNILGSSIRGFFTSIQEATLASGSISEAAKISWGDLIGVLTGGTAIAGISIGAMGGLGAFFWMLLPILLGALVSIIIGLVTIAARQALVSLLVMISPLAFVLYLLPNTEKLFTKWKDIFIKMLIFYPMFSLLYGASQLAGWVIITSADNAFNVILGMAVQIFPLIFSWSLMKMSGTVLGKLNDGLQSLRNGPRKALGAYSAEKRAIAQSESARKGLMKPFNPLSGRSWLAKNTQEKANRDDKLRTANEDIKNLTDEAIMARKNNRRILGYDKHGKPIYSSKPFNPKSTWGRDSLKETTREFENREIKLRVAASKQSLENTMNTMSTHLDKNKIDDQHLNILAENQAQNYLDFETQNTAARRNALSDKRFYFNSIKKAEALGKGSAQYKRLIEGGAGADFHVNSNLTGVELAEARKLKQDAEFSVIADAYDMFEKERQTNIAKYTTYLGKQVTKKVLDRYDDFWETKNIDAIVASQNTLAARGDYDKIHERLRENLKGNYAELGSDFSNTLALNLLSFKDKDATLGRFGKHINMQTWQYTDGKRADKNITFQEFFTGRSSDGRQLNKGMNIVSLMQGTGLAGMDRTFFNGLNDDIKNFYTAKNFGSQAEADKAKKALYQAILPAVTGAIPKFESESEPMINTMQFMTGLKYDRNKDDWTFDKDFKNWGEASRSELLDYDYQIWDYLHFLSPEQLIGMKTDTFQSIIKRFSYEFGYDDNRSKDDPANKAAREQAILKFRDIFSNKKNIHGGKLDRNGNPREGNNAIERLLSGDRSKLAGMKESIRKALGIEI